MSLLGRVKELRIEVDGLARSSESALGSVRRLAEESEAQTSRLTESARRVEESSQRLEELGRQQATVLDDIAARAAEMGQFGEELAQQITLVKDGALTVEEFRTTWGQAIVDVRGGRQTIDEALTGLDPQQFQRRAQELRQALEQEALGLGDVVALIGEQTGLMAEQLQRAIDLMQDGRASVQEVIAQAQRLEQQLGADSQLGVLAGGLADILRETRQGGL